MMNKKRTSFLVVVQVILYGLALLGLGWANVRYSQSYPQRTDFLTQWSAMRSYLIDGGNPYDAAQWQAKLRIWGGPERPASQPNVFRWPFYTGLLILPFALIPDFYVANGLWMLLLQLALVGLVIVAAQLVQWKPPLLVWSGLIVYCLFSLHSFQAMFTGSSSVLAGLFLALALLALRKGWQEAAGLFFALATIEPGVALLPIAFGLFWVLSRRQSRVWVWFFAGMGALGVIGSFLISDWTWQYMRIIWNLRQGAMIITPINAFSAWWPGAGRQLAWGFNIIVILILGIEWFAGRAKDFRWFTWTMCLTIALGQWVGIPTRPHFFSVLLIPMVLVFAVWQERMERAGYWLAIFSTLLIWLVGWLVYLRLLSDPGAVLGQFNLLFILPFAMLIGLYWIRWWCIRPQKLFVEQLRANENLR